MTPSPFRNESFIDFSVQANIDQMHRALHLVTEQFGREYPLIIGGKNLTADKKITSINPCRHSQVVGIAQSATAAQTEQALDAAWNAFETWKNVPAAERADVVFKMAEILRRRKWELSAWLVFEVGKSWAEADGDVAEAIDFCEFYAREALRYAQGQPTTPFPGENNTLTYIPLGAGAIIPPWNFPLAILTGMTVAAVVCGNTVVLKPASQTPIIAAKFMEVAQEAGLPAGVINFVTGSGGEVGEHLIQHPRLRFVCFTGSKQVGLHIVEASAKPRPGQKWIRRVSAEMGGKDAIIVDGEADLAAAVDAVVRSAFGFQGQKCSACSRAIVDVSLYDAFVEHLKERVEKITMGPTVEHEHFMGAVISKDAFASISAYISIGKQEGRLLCGGGCNDKEGYFIEPTVFTDVSPTARIAQEEIFGPVLAVIKAHDFDDALNIANNTEYGLTGAVFTRNPQKIERAKREFFVGNLYINRKCTGALVDVQPFGGYNMSGTCAKAGGRDYLLHFVQGKAISERL